MSYVLDGIVVPATAEEAHVINVMERIKFDVIPVDNKSSLLARLGRAEFQSGSEGLAALLSRTFNCVLHLCWDDRVGFRQSSVYREGSLARKYGLADELYVELDEDSIPSSNEKRYRECEIGQFGEDREFEVALNALQLGCQDASICEWGDLKQLIQQQV